MNIANLQFIMDLPEVLEAVMLVCFGVAWPCASLRMLRTGRPQSNGLCFTLIILCGYLFGAGSKMLVTLRGAELAPVFWLYAINAVSVAVNLGLQVYFGRGSDPPFDGARGNCSSKTRQMRISASGDEGVEVGVTPRQSAIARLPRQAPIQMPQRCPSQTSNLSEPELRVQG